MAKISKKQKPETKIGLVFDLPPEIQSGAQDASDCLEAVEFIVDRFSKRAKKEQESLWRTIREAYPEYDFENFIWHYNKVKGTIECKRRAWSNFK